MGFPEIFGVPAGGKTVTKLKNGGILFVDQAYRPPKAYNLADYLPRAEGEEEGAGARDETDDEDKGLGKSVARMMLRHGDMPRPRDRLRAVEDF